MGHFILLVTFLNSLKDNDFRAYITFNQNFPFVPHIYSCEAFV